MILLLRVNARLWDENDEQKNEIWCATDLPSHSPFSIPYRISYISFSKLLSATRSRNRGIIRTRIEEENSNSIFIKLTLLNEFLYKGM